MTRETGTKKSFFQKEWPLALKILLALLALWFIFKQVSEKEVDEFIVIYRQLAQHRSNWVIFIILDILMGVNWYLEAFKWKILVEKFERIRVFTALRATLSGVTISFFTPNRMGEFAGRIMHIGPGARLQAALASLIGSASQLMVTLIVGAYGLCFFLPAYLELPKNYLVIFIFVASGITAVLLNMFFHFGFLTRVLTHLRVLHRFEKHLQVFRLYSSRELFKILSFSIFRYLIFTIQFIIILNMMGLQLPFIKIFGLIAVIYLALALIPTIAFLTELPVRGSVALYVLGQYSSEHSPILCASFSIWFLNIVFPAVIGALFIFYFRFTR